MKKRSDSTIQSSRRLSKKETKKQLIDSLVYDDKINTEDLNMRVNRVEDYEEAMNIIKEYEDIIKKNKKNIIFFAYQRDEIYRKFKENR